MAIPSKVLQTPSDSETLANLRKVRRDLMEQLRHDQEEDHSSPRFSLFSSPRNYRKDELHNGLNDHVAGGDFCNS
jgi:hypothetical protein